MPRLGRAWDGLATDIDRWHGDEPCPAWRRVSTAVGQGQWPTAQPGLVARLPRLVFVTVDLDDVTVLRRLVHRPGAPAGLVTLADVLDLDLGADGVLVRNWGADGPVLIAPPPAVLAALGRIAGRVHTRWP